MRVIVDYDPRGMRRFLASAGRLASPRAQLAMARALNKTGDRARTQVRRALKVQMGVKRYGAIKAATDTIPAVPGRLTYTIKGQGRGLPIREFPVRKVAKGVKASPWRKARLFKRSFVSGGRFMARRGRKRFPIRGLRGPAVAKEIVKDSSAETFVRVAGELIPHLSRQMARLLG